MVRVKVDTTELDELLLDVIMQACSLDGKELDTMCLKAYEAACDYLTQQGYFTTANGRIYKLKKEVCPNIANPNNICNKGYACDGCPHNEYPGIPNGIQGCQESQPQCIYGEEKVNEFCSCGWRELDVIELSRPLSSMNIGDGGVAMCPNCGKKYNFRLVNEGEVKDDTT